MERLHFERWVRVFLCFDKNLKQQQSSASNLFKYHGSIFVFCVALVNYGTTSCTSIWAVYLAKLRPAPFLRSLR